MCDRFVVLVLVVLVSLASFAGAQELRDTPLARARDAMRKRTASLDEADRRLDSRLRTGDETSTSLRPRLRGAPATATGCVHVTVAFVGPPDDVLPGLVTAGLEIVRLGAAQHLVDGWIPATRLRQLAAQPGVRSVRPVDRGVSKAGSMLTAGDVASGAAAVRQSLGLDGSGVRVGVISDGIDGLAAAQSTGDLPAVIVPSDPRCSLGAGNEGTALLEIVHDLAPGADLVFSSGIASALTFIQAVECLVAAGARVIVDDLGFATQPYFEDGPVAAAVRAAVAAGVSFHSAAGNGALLHYEAPFRASPGTRFHDFRGGPVDNVDTVLIAPGGTLLCVLQWDDPFGGAGNDYDLLVLDANQNVVASSGNVQNGNDDPLEVVMASNPTATAQTAGLAIERQRGGGRTLELFCMRDVTAVEHVVSTGSVVGHAALAEVVTAGAMDVGGGLRAYSAQGPSRIVFPGPADRPKPDLVAFDGVLTSAPGFAPFFGTSAATPHVAAVAAMLLQRNPFRTPAEVQQTLTATAADVGVPGVDVVAGAGRLDAVAAVATTPIPECFADGDCDDASVCTEDRCGGGVCVHTVAACDDGDPCNGLEGCDPVGGCTAGTPLPDGAPCPDGNACNGDEICRAAACRPGTALLCADADACSVDTCGATIGCAFPPRTGFDSVSCAIGRGLPACAGGPSAGVLRRFAAAERLVERGRVARRRGPQRQRLQRAVATLATAIRLTNRDVRRGRLSAECAAQVAEALHDVRDRARLLKRALRR